MISEAELSYLGILTEWYSFTEQNFVIPEVTYDIYRKG